MFSGCNTIQELNQRKNQLKESGVSILAINTEYNKMRRKLMGAVQTYTTINTQQYHTGEKIPYSAVNYLGPADKPNTISIMPEGVRF